jgi:DNA-binding transcriptional LysR family regulator
MLNLHELNVFVEAALVENFSVAAQHLGLSQPAVSLQIRNLERQHGVDLFRRNGRNVTLSDAGRTLLPLAQELLHQAKHIEAVMSGLEGLVVGELCVACGTTAGKYVLPQLIARYRQQCPDVQVTITMLCRRSAADWVVEGRADIALMSAEVMHRDLETRAILEDDVVLIVPAGHPWSSGPDVGARDLLGLPLILREPTSNTYATLAQALAQHGLSSSDLKVAMVLSDVDAITMSVEAGIGGAFVPRLAAARALKLGCVAEVAVNDLALKQTIYVARHRRRCATAPQQAFWSFACDPEIHLLQLA